MLSTSADDAFTTALAEKICERLAGIRFDAQEAELRLRLVLEQRATGASAISFGLDRLTTIDAARYLGLQPETLRATAKRKALELPTPYMYGKKLYWRRSELDAWVEQQRRDPRVAARGAAGGSATAADNSKSDWVERR
jgi:predicted DNA-binding transcriptional regulator AlpA